MNYFCGAEIRGPRIHLRRDIHAVHDGDRRTIGLDVHACGDEQVACLVGRHTRFAVIALVSAERRDTTAIVPNQHRSRRRVGLLPSPIR